MQQYKDLLFKILGSANEKNDRTGTGTLSVFGHQMRFDLQKGFPLLTTKKIHVKSVVHELLWFLRGETNIKYLNDNGVRIWDEWADSNGDLGPVYGAQWRSWPSPKHGNPNASIDQISNLITNIKTDPDSRRLMVSAWNVSEIDKMALAPCHVLFQFYVSQPKFQSEDKRKLLSCQLYQRSADVFLGVPFNIASYSLLTHMIAQQCDLNVGEFIWTGGDCHVYSNHLDQAIELQSREPRSLPRLHLKRKPSDIFGYLYDDFEFIDYDPYPAIKARVAV